MLEKEGPRGLFCHLQTHQAEETRDVKPPFEDERAVQSAADPVTTRGEGGQARGP